MRRLLLVFTFVLCAVAAVAAEPPVCTEKGTVLELRLYNAKGEAMGYERTTVMAVDRTPEGWTRVTCRSAALDSNRKPVVLDEEKGTALEMDQHYLIRDKDMVRYMPFDLSAFGADFEGVNVTVSGDDYTLPIEPVAGSELPDIAMNFKINAGEGMMNINLKFKVTDRKVSAREKITTPAGEFEAFRITEKVTATLFIASDSYMTESWYVPGLGLVRENRCTRRGKLESYTELLSIGRSEVE